MTNIPKELKREYDYYLANQSELLKKYKNKFIVIKDRAVVGSFETEFDAYSFAVQNFSLGTFLIQKCSRKEDNHTQTFHSRVVLY